MNTIMIMLAVNDNRGEHTGFVGDIEFEDGSIDCLLKLERQGGQDPRCVYYRSARMLQIGRKKFPILSYGENVGNVFCDCATVTTSIAAEIAKYLLSLNSDGNPKYDATEAIACIFSKLEHDEPLTEWDFAGELSASASERKANADQTRK